MDPTVRIRAQIRGRLLSGQAPVHRSILVCLFAIGHGYILCRTPVDERKLRRARAPSCGSSSFTEVEQLNSTQRTVLYRVAQSALANVHKHARATQATVGIRKLPKAIRLEIHDSGKSFEMERVLFAKRHERLGLLGSRERVEMVGGKFAVASAPGHGTTIGAEIPVTSEGPKTGPKIRKGKLQK
jgi:hypothetical protein